MKIGIGVEKGSITRLPVGGLFDITTGRYVKGYRGEQILTGGISPFMGVVAPPNFFKTTLAYFFMHKVGQRYKGPLDFINTLMYDTENSADIRRMNDFTAPLHLPEDWSIEDYMPVDPDDERPVRFLQKIDIQGDKMWDLQRTHMAEKIKSKGGKITLPWPNRKGEKVKSNIFEIIFTDSLTEYGFEAHDKKMDKATLGEGETNMEGMHENRDKSNMIRRVVNIAPASSTYMIYTAHIGKAHQLDPRAPKEKKLALLKGDIKMKRIPNDFTFLAQDCYYINKCTVTNNSSSDRRPLYPTKRGGNFEDSNELWKISIHNIRGKSGPSGFTIDLLVSQNDGILEGVSMYDYCKNNGYFGIPEGKGASSFTCALIPDVKLQRTTVRDKIHDDPKQTRAWKILAEMRYMQIAGVKGCDLVVDPKELYENMKKLGYDWDQLLTTRDYWLPQEWEKDQPPYMSTLDLLEINAGIKKAYWI